jgi:Thiamine pyrophosphate enzyme, C-terminal TPP binding domain
LFRKALKPMVDATRSLTDAITTRRSARTQPDAGSLAMREIQDDASYGARSGLDHPFTVIHSLGGLTLLAATDHVRVYGDAFGENGNGAMISTHAHLVVARAALEASVVSAWLNEPGVARDERMRRGLSEFIYSAVEQQRVRYQPGGWARAREWIEHATNLGWLVTDWEGNTWGRDTRGDPQVDGVMRPGMPVGVRDLVVGDEASKIGKLEWSRLSAVSHATWVAHRLSLNGGRRWIISGAQVASPHRQVVCVTGDGSLQMNMPRHSLCRATPGQDRAARQPLLGNGPRTAGPVLQRRVRVRPASALDWSALARACGIGIAESVRDPLAEPGPALHHVRIPADAECLPLVAPGASTATMIG